MVTFQPLVLTDSHKPCADITIVSWRFDPTGPKTHSWIRQNLNTKLFVAHLPVLYEQVRVPVFARGILYCLHSASTFFLDSGLYFYMTFMYFFPKYIINLCHAKSLRSALPVSGGASGLVHEGLPSGLYIFLFYINCIYYTRRMTKDQMGLEICIIMINIICKTKNRSHWMMRA